MKRIIFLLILLIFISGCIQQPKTLKGAEILEVKVTMDNGAPLEKIEVDLWRAGSTGAPDAGINYTDENGSVIFNIPDGEYDIGFNLDHFPSNLEYPEKTLVVVEKGIPASKLKNKNTFLLIY
jgi:hypothetical protein